MHWKAFGLLKICYRQIKTILFLGHYKVSHVVFFSLMNSTYKHLGHLFTNTVLPVCVPFKKTLWLFLTTAPKHNILFQQKNYLRTNKRVGEEAVDKVGAQLSRKQQQKLLAVAVNDHSLLSCNNTVVSFKFSRFYKFNTRTGSYCSSTFISDLCS